MSKRITVIIPACNNRYKLAECLKALSNNEYENYEVIVVDDCSIDDSAAAARKYGCKVAKTSRRLGPAVARQEGLKYATGEIVAFLDSDCRPASKWLRQIDSYLTKEVGGIGGIYTYEEKGNYFSLFLRYFSQYWFGRWPQKETDFLLGGNSAYWINVLHAERPCKELMYFKGISSGDDTLMNLELSRKYKLLFVPELKVIHSYFGFGEFLKKQFKWGFSRTIISLLYFREKLWRAKDLPVVQILGQLLATALFLISLFTLNVYLILPALTFLLLVHLHNLVYLYRKTTNILFIPYAFFVLLSRNLIYLLGAAKGVVFLFSKKIEYWIDIIRIVLNYLNPYVPSKLHFFLTSQCNAKCEYCFLEPAQCTKAVLSIEKIKEVIKKLGVLPYVIITGGEPFLRNDVALICKLFYDYCLSRFFVIATNGFFTEKIVTQVKEVLRDCPNAHITVGVSIDGIGLAHDCVKKLADSFQRAVATIEKLQKLKRYFQNLSVNISTVVTKENNRNLGKISAYFRKNYEVDNYFVTLKRCSPKTVDIKDIRQEDYFSVLKGIVEPSQNYPQTFFSKVYKHLYASVIDEMQQLLKRGRYLRPCLAARKFLVLNEKAQLCLCELRKEKIGNLTEAKSLNTLLRSKEAKALREKVREEKCFCNWGCAVTANFIFSPSVYPRLIISFLYKLITERKNRG